MSEEQEYRCRVCGGMLEIDKESFGFSKCANCGNKFRISSQESRRLRELAPKENTNLFVAMTPTDVEKEVKTIKKSNAIFVLKGIMAFMSLIILGMLICIMTFLLQGKLSLENVEIAIVALIGIGIPAFMTIFAKVYKGKRESLLLTTFMFILFSIVTATVCYFASAKYFIVLM